jgi:hypothetical protein
MPPWITNDGMYDGNKMSTKIFKIPNCAINLYPFCQLLCKSYVLCFILLVCLGKDSHPIIKHHLIVGYVFNINGGLC